MYPDGMELIFEIRDAEEGGYLRACARLQHFHGGGHVGRTPESAIEAVSLHFEESAVRPRPVQLHYVKDELQPIEAA
jgi:hypothetical protein